MSTTFAGGCIAALRAIYHGNAKAPYFRDP